MYKYLQLMKKISHHKPKQKEHRNKKQQKQNKRKTNKQKTKTKNKKEIGASLYKKDLIQFIQAERVKGIFNT